MIMTHWTMPYIWIDSTSRREWSILRLGLTEQIKNHLFTDKMKKWPWCSYGGGLNNWRKPILCNTDSTNLQNRTIMQKATINLFMDLFRPIYSKVRLQNNAWMDLCVLMIIYCSNNLLVSKFCPNPAKTIQWLPLVPPTLLSTLP